MAKLHTGYLDYNATAPVRPEVVSAVTSVLESAGNPSSVHKDGRGAKAKIEAARETIARLAGSTSGTVIFTSGGTEANNLALCSSANQGRHLIVSAVEHDSVLNVSRDRSDRSSQIPVTRDGIVDVEYLSNELSHLSERTVVSVMLANNETGVIQPIARVVEVARAHGAIVHCDGVQGPGKIPVNLEELGADLMTLSAHKFGGPQGVGALVIREGAESPGKLLYGGGQEQGHRAGTENVPGIVGFGAAAASVLSDPGEAGRMEALRDKLEAEVCSLGADTFIISTNVPRLPNTSCIVMPGVPAETQVMSLDLAGVRVSAGAACSSGKVSSSHVLRAMGLPEVQNGSAIRVSLGWASQAEDVEHFVEAWQALHRRLGNRSAA
jgi:cysteine desulfurase